MNSGTYISTGAPVYPVYSVITTTTGNPVKYVKPVYKFKIFLANPKAPHKHEFDWDLAITAHAFDEEGAEKKIPAQMKDWKVLEIKKAHGL